MKASKIAQELNLHKQDVNRHLYNDQTTFVLDTAAHTWSFPKKKKKEKKTSELPEGSVETAAPAHQIIVFGMSRDEWEAQGPSPTQLLQNRCQVTPFLSPLNVKSVTGIILSVSAAGGLVVTQFGNCGEILTLLEQREEPPAEVAPPS